MRVDCTCTLYMYMYVHVHVHVHVHVDVDTKDICVEGNMPTKQIHQSQIIK